MFDSAFASADVYNLQSNNEMLPGWERRITDDVELARLGLSADDLQKSDGYYAAVYKDDMLSEPIFANRGSIDIKSYIADFGVVTNHDPQQYKDAEFAASEIYNATGGHVLFTGHSLGGGLASAQAIVTGAKAIIFNAPGIGEATIADYGPQAEERFNNPDKLITSYDFNGELIQWAQNNKNLFAGGAVIAGLAIKSPLVLSLAYYAANAPSNIVKPIVMPAVDQNGALLDTSGLQIQNRTDWHSMNWMLYSLSHQLGLGH